MDIREGVRKAYSNAAVKPGAGHPFPVGRAFAESLGYSKEVLDSVPSVSVKAFAGVSNVSVFAEIPEGSTVLDLGCGAGLDTLIASGKTGPDGKVLGIDFSDEMISRARQALEETGIKNVELHLTEAEQLPIEDGSIDVALVNGIFNLNPARDSIFSELARVVKKDGHLYAAELIKRKSIFEKLFIKKNAEKTYCKIDNMKEWFA
jgi:ubiquinone/menaquinone biosynthesis C-methylase UbiE